MWETYRGDDDPKPEQPRPEQPEISLYPPTTPDRSADFPTRPARSSCGTGVAIGGVAIAIAIAIGAASGADDSASSGSEYQDWYDCIDSYSDEEPGFLTPADLCEIGHERPPGYTEFDDYDWSYEQDYDSWDDVP